MYILQQQTQIRIKRRYSAAHCEIKRLCISPQVTSMVTATPTQMTTTSEAALMVPG
jgi:hypothetical protein